MENVLSKREVMIYDNWTRFLVRRESYYEIQIESRRGQHEQRTGTGSW